MEMKQVNGIFEIAIGIFNLPSSVIQISENLWRERITWKICHNTFIGTIRQLKSDYTKSNLICIRIFEKIKIIALDFNE